MLFEGYGLNCPICKTKLMAQMSQFRTRVVKLTEDKWINIVLCCNCRDAISYTKQVYFCNDERNFFDNKDHFMDIINSNEDNISLKICFEMTSGINIYHDIKITPVHRKLIQNELSK